MSESKQTSRRGFLRAATGAIALPYLIPRTALGGAGRVAPNDRITIGLIGCGGMGRTNVRHFMGHADARVVAVCDVDEKHLAGAAADVDKRYGNEDCKKYKDFRELIARDDIDAVCIATPDHWHALCAVEAAKAKKHIYCQKPMTHTFAEGQAVVRAVRENDVTFQVGSQQRSDGLFRKAVELVLNGVIGKVKSVEIGLPTGHREARGERGLPEELEDQDPPPHVDYGFWCGPSEKLPFVPARFHWNWRWHLSYGGGQLMDWIGHHNDIAHWALGYDESGPVEVRAVGFEYPEDRRVWNAAWKYEVQCKYADGVTTSISNRHRLGCKWIGEDGWIFVTRGTARASNETWLAEGFVPGEKKAYLSRDHERNFLDGIKEKKACICPAETGHRSITPGHLGLLSEALGGRVLRWDPKEEKVIGDDEADRLLKRIDYRKPWSLGEKA